MNESNKAQSLTGQLLKLN